MTLPKDPIKALLCCKKISEQMKKNWENDDFRKKQSEIRKGNKNPTKRLDVRKKLCENHADVSGNHNYNWKGGKTIHTKGYIMLYSPEHPFAVKNYVQEHRLVVEKQLGRFLNPEERVHHINEIKEDNRLENLYLFKNTSEHISFHQHKHFLISNII